MAHAFDEPAWDAYRASIATLSGGEPEADPCRSEIDRMPDHDGDDERTVALLSGGDHPYYRETLRRLCDAGRSTLRPARRERASELATATRP